MVARRWGMAEGPGRNWRARGEEEKVRTKAGMERRPPEESKRRRGDADKDNVQRRKRDGHEYAA